MQRMFEKVIFQHGDPNIVGARYDVGRSSHFVDLKNCGLVVIALRGFPGTTSQEIRVVKRGVVVAPIANVLDGTRASDRGLESCALSDQPIGHIAAVAVSANTDLIGIGNTILD